jgi:hypothetical protein
MARVPRHRTIEIVSRLIFGIPVFGFGLSPFIYEHLHSVVHSLLYRLPNSGFIREAILRAFGKREAQRVHLMGPGVGRSPQTGVPEAATAQLD